MSRKALLLILSGLPYFLHAQFTASVQLPPGGMVTKDQLWNIVLANNNNESIDVSILLDLQDAGTGISVMTASTGSFMIGKGVRLTTQKEIQPIQYNYSSNDFMGNYIPMGNYVACYRVQRMTTKGPEALADECIRMRIAPLSPPLLTLPLDKSVSQTKYPLFSWTPPTPIDMFTGLTYDIVVTEILEGQSASEAVLNNQAIYERSGLKNTFDNYPSTSIALDTGQLYAWQVIARNGTNYAAQTEVWTFSIAGDNRIDKLIKGSPFIKLNKANPEAGIVLNGQLKLSFNNRLSDSTATVSIQNLESTSEPSHSFTVPIKRGENNIQFDLKKIMKYQENRNYQATITDSRGDKWIMLFRIVIIKDNN